MNPRPTGPKPVALPNCATPRYSLVHIGRGSRIRTHGTWFWRPLLYQLSYTPTLTRTTLRNRFAIYGGEDGIRTHAALANPNDLANRPLQPLEYFSRLKLNSLSYTLLIRGNRQSVLTREAKLRPDPLVSYVAERVGFEPTAPFGVTGFQDQLLKPLGHLSSCSSVSPCSAFPDDPMPFKW